MKAAGDAKPTAKQAPASTADNSSFKTPAPPKAATRLGGAEAAAAAAGGKAAAAGGGGGDSPPLTITVLDPVSTGGKGAVAKTVMGPPASKTPAAFKTPAPPVSEQVGGLCACTGTLWTRMADSCKQPLQRGFLLRM